MKVFQGLKSPESYETGKLENFIQKFMPLPSWMSPECANFLNPIVSKQECRIHNMAQPKNRLESW